MPVNVQTAIEDFWIARARGEYFPQAYFDRLTLDDAYHIQLGIIDRRVAAGEHHIGWKVGLTAKPQDAADRVMNSRRCISVRKLRPQHCIR